MSIKKHISYVKHEGSSTGYVNLGGSNEDYDETASEALVIMAVGIKKHWKAPISFHFINGIKAETQKGLLFNAIESLAVIDIRARLVIMDGHRTNISMMKKLGCELGSGNVTFTPPFDSNLTIYCMLDPVHMIKVLRNCLGDHQTIITPDGVARWKHIESLVSLQNSSHLHLANKLTNQHVNYKDNKMKVKYAVQVFSQSTGDALTTLSELQADYPEFAQADQTGKFLKVSNCITNSYYVGL